MAQVRVQVMLEPIQHEALKAYSLAEGRSVSELIREAVDSLLDARERNQSAEEARAVEAARRLRERQAVYQVKRGDK